MNKKRLHICIFALMLAAFPLAANAQVEFGVKAGATFNDHNTSGISLDNATSWQAGIMTRFKLPIVGFKVQPELLYTRKNAENTNVKSSVNYIEVPLNLVFSLKVRSIEPFIMAGPYFSYAADFNGDFNTDNIKRFDWGIGASAGLDFRMLHAGIRYEWGLQNVSNVDAFDIKNNTLSLFVGIFL